MAKSERARERGFMFLNFLISRVTTEKPDVLEDAQYIINLHRGQHAGYKNLAVVMQQLNLLVGEEYWSAIYFEFLRAQTNHRPETHHRHIQAEQQERQRQNTKPEVTRSVANGKPGEVIDLTDSTDTEEKDPADAKMVDRDVDTGQEGIIPPQAAAMKNRSAREDTAATKIKQVVDKSSIQAHATQPSGIFQRTNHPAQFRFQHGGMSPRKHVLFMAQLESPPGKPHFPLATGTPFSPPTRQSISPRKPPSPASDAQSGRHYSLFSRMQRQVKDDTSRSMVYVHNTLSNLQHQNKYLHQQALSIIEECLRRSSNQEIGYEFVANAVCQRIKALILLGDSSVIKASNFGPTNQTKEIRYERSQRETVLSRETMNPAIPPPQFFQSHDDNKKQAGTKNQPYTPSTPKQHDDEQDGQTNSEKSPSPSSLNYSPSSPSLPSRQRSSFHRNPLLNRLGERHNKTSLFSSKCPRGSNRPYSPRSPLISRASCSSSDVSTDWSRRNHRSRAPNLPTHDRSVFQKKRQWSSSPSSDSDSDRTRMSSSSGSSKEHAVGNFRSRSSLAFKRRKMVSRKNLDASLAFKRRKLVSRKNLDAVVGTATTKKKKSQTQKKSKSTEEMVLQGTSRKQVIENEPSVSPVSFEEAAAKKKELDEEETAYDEDDSEVQKKTTMDVLDK
ncbi:hypothetical protein IV203_003429 [Nitzschia inconspicua]|uniref:Uncharacterized protein n=1 Tax=Nitzschia inconspicua TaxID=303405 RepID=A0A9K3PNP8_9STRA|nr:hypothetical protein IV203_003429 [Nitzschia inconspicua]